jgi:hypothetical protein
MPFVYYAARASVLQAPALPTLWRMTPAYPSAWMLPVMQLRLLRVQPPLRRYHWSTVLCRPLSPLAVISQSAWMDTSAPICCAIQPLAWKRRWSTGPSQLFRSQYSAALASTSSPQQLRPQPAVLCCSGLNQQSSAALVSTGSPKLLRPHPADLSRSGLNWQS